MASAFHSKQVEQLSRGACLKQLPDPMATEQRRFCSSLAPRNISLVRDESRRAIPAGDDWQDRRRRGLAGPSSMPAALPPARAPFRDRFRNDGPFWARRRVQQIRFRAFVTGQRGRRGRDLPIPRRMAAEVGENRPEEAVPIPGIPIGSSRPVTRGTPQVSYRPVPPVLWPKAGLSKRSRGVLERT